MLINLPDPDRYFSLKTLRHHRDTAREAYFKHADPGGMTPAEKKAWEFEHFALQLLLSAAQIKLDAEEELSQLLAAEVAA